MNTLFILKEIYELKSVEDPAPIDVTTLVSFLVQLEMLCWEKLDPFLNFLNLFWLLI